MPHKMPPVRVFRSLLMFKNRIPHRARFWSVIMFALFYQFTGGVYLASISQIVGEMAYISEDVTMASYCSLIGLNIIFPMLFRWKFFFFTRQLWFVTAIGEIICAIAAMYVGTPWLFWLISLISGYLKMMGMFGCMSTIQLCATPTRNFGVFLPMVYVLVCGAIQLSGIVTTWVAYFTSWKMMYMVIVVMMIIVNGCVYFMMKPDHRSGPFVPLKGIDWFGQFLWIAVCVCGTYIFNFGHHYDWWESQEIWNATWLALFFLVILLFWMQRCKEPYISPKAFSFPFTWWTIFLLLMMAFAQASAHAIQPIFVAAILQYDSLASIQFSWPELAGIIMGAILAYFILVRLKWSQRQYFFLCFLFVGMYAGGMYMMCTADITPEILYFPIFALGLAEVMMETGATYYLSQSIPFPVFFMNIAIIGFARCGLGTSAAGAVMEEIFAYQSGEYGLLYGIREAFGWAAIVSVGMLPVTLLANFRKFLVRLLPRNAAVVKDMIQGKLSHT